MRNAKILPSSRGLFAYIYRINAIKLRESQVEETCRKDSWNNLTSHTKRIRYLPFYIKIQILSQNIRKYLHYNSIHRLSATDNQSTYRQ